MKKGLLVLLMVALALSACTSPLDIVSTLAPTPTLTLTPAPTPTPNFPPVVGADPSYRVAAFYYPWYRNLKHDAKWVHWGEGEKNPPKDITSDYYPLLGPYSSLDPEVVAQHFAWMRQAGIGVAITSWWGKYTDTDRVVPLLLKMGERYGIKVAFLIESTGTRTADTLLADVEYLYKLYGDHPAFFRTNQGSLWSSGEKQQGLFLMWGVRFETDVGDPVEPSYWQQVMDQIHALPDGGLMIADENDREWVTDGHFDGTYKYGALDSDMAEPYTFANALPTGAWYIPGVNPGFTRSHNVGYEDFTYSPRKDGEAYAARWQAMFDLGIEPPMVAITTFNEWHEGTQIEPAVSGIDNGAGYQYRDFESLPPDGYITLTRQWVETFLAHEWPETRKAIFRIRTTSDWTALGLVDGGGWIQPNYLSASEEALDTRMEGEYLVLTQPIERAESGESVEMVVEMILDIDQGSAPLVFNIARGGLGYTEVEVIVDKETGSEVVAVMRWDGWADNGDNSRKFEMPVEVLGEQ